MKAVLLGDSKHQVTANNLPPTSHASTQLSNSSHNPHPTVTQQENSSHQPHPTVFVSCSYSNFLSCCMQDLWCNNDARHNTSCQFLFTKSKDSVVNLQGHYY